MLRSVKDIKNYPINARDGEMGTAKEFFFDDRNWHLRYLVVNVGNWFMRKEILIAPESILKINQDTIEVNLTKEQVKNSPMIEADKPLYLQQQIALHQYYNWPFYWDQGDPFVTPVPFGAPFTNTKVVEDALDHNQSTHTKQNTNKQTNKNQRKYDPHLRSSKQIAGYSIKSTDEEFGHLEDFILDTEKMAIPYLVVDTKNWIPGKKVLLPRDWVQKISFETLSISFEVSREQIENSPEYDPKLPINREFAERVYNFTGRSLD